MKNKKILPYRIIGLVIKVLIVLAAFFFLYKQLFLDKSAGSVNGDRFDQVRAHLVEVLQDTSFLIVLILVFVLMIVNWTIEAWKWQYLITKIEKVSLIKALKATLAGATVSMFTPNRIGEYGGRVFYLYKADRLKAVLITIIGSVSQMLVTCVLGILGLVYYLLHYFSDDMGRYMIILLMVLGFLVIGLALLLFLNASVLTAVINKLSFLGKLRKYGTVFSYYSSAELFKVLMISTVRYLVFSSQFYILLLLFGVDLSILEGFSLIAVTYLVLSIVPSFALLELGLVRGEIAIYFIGSALVIDTTLADHLALGIYSASFTIWMINVAFPALVGTVFVFGLKFFRKNNQ